MISDSNPGSPPLLSSGEVIARLAEGGPAGGVVAFDADGTLWSGDIGIDGFERLLETGDVRALAGPALEREAAACGVPSGGDANDLARALYAAFERGAYAEDRAFATMAWAFAGRSERELEAFASDLVRDVALSERLHAEVTPILRFCVDRRIPVLVVSASPETVVRVAVEQLGLPVTRVLAMSPAVENGVVMPRLAGPATYGAGKTEALRAASPAEPLLAAFGDSAYDFPMLAEAALGVMVRPKSELRARARRHASIVELSPAP